ncbi:MAG: MarR family transcriptional regulator, partial [Acidobacteriota bacterium]|nr:MarR family transcriptional regulator [Acidobacteriota bacterium]
MDFRAWTRFLRAHAALTRELSSRLETAHGLSLRDYDVLVQLYGAPDRRMRRIDLARTVILSPSGITRLLEGLERAGWVGKHA